MFFLVWGIFLDCVFWGFFIREDKDLLSVYSGSGIEIN